MTLRILAFVLLLSAFATVAMAQTPPDFVYFDAQIGAIQHHIDAATASNSLKPEVLQDLQGKQKELIEREAKLKAVGKMTADEKSALALSIRQQQQRLTGFTKAAAPRVKRVDPASLPSPTYVEPSGGVTISGANAGQTPAQTGVVTVPAPTVPVIHSPAAPTTGYPAQR